jgi:hypothetical protein
MKTCWACSRPVPGRQCERCGARGGYVDRPRPKNPKLLAELMRPSTLSLSIHGGLLECERLA